MTWKHRGVEISIQDSGQFRAVMEDELIVTANSLVDIQAKIDKELGGKSKRVLNLKVVGIERSRKERRVFHGVIVGVNRTTRNLKVEGCTSGFEYGAVVPDTPENVAYLERYMKAEMEMEEVNQQRKEKVITVSGYGRIEAEDYDDILDDLATLYGRLIAKNAGA